MKLTYQVPREVYIELLAEMIRRNERRPIRVATALLMTVGQMAVVILLCIFRLEAGQRLFFLIWSVLLAGLTVLRRATVRQRAKGTLQRLEYTGQLSQDFWEEHRLSTAGGELRLAYGVQKLSCLLPNLTRVEESSDTLYLYCGETVFDLVPSSVFPSREAMKDFAKTLRELAAGAEMPAAQPAENDGLLWRMEEKQFEDGQYLAYRTLFYRYRFWRPATFARLAVSVFAVISLMNGAAGFHLALCVVLLILANLENLSMVPFVCRLRIRREVGAWRGSVSYRLSLRGDTLRFASDRAKVNIPTGKINLCEKIGPYFVIAWNTFPAVVLPQEVLQTPEGADLVREIQALYQGK